MTEAFQQLLLDLALVAGPVKAQSFEGPKTTGSKEEDPVLHLHDYPADPAWWLGRWTKCHSERSQREILEELQDLVDSLKRSKRHMMKGTKEWRRFMADESRKTGVRYVSRTYAVSSRDVVRARKEFPAAG